MTTKNYAINFVIPELNSLKAKGYTRSAIAVPWALDALKVLSQVNEESGYTGTVCGGTIYFKLK